MWPFDKPDMTPEEEAIEAIEVLLDNGHDKNDRWMKEAIDNLATIVRENAQD